MFGAYDDLYIALTLFLKESGSLIRTTSGLYLFKSTIVAG